MQMKFDMLDISHFHVTGTQQSETMTEYENTTARWQFCIPSG